MATITVPKTPAKAFNPRRPPSDLIRQQIRHLEWALLPASQRQPKRLKDGTLKWFKGGTAKTEAQAAAYIALLTARVREAYADVQTRAARGLPRDAGPAAPVRLPKVPVVTFSTPLRTKPQKPQKARTARKAGKTSKKTTPKTATAARRRR
jgi:hypothetical protein